MNVLIIEDSESLRRSLQHGLKRSGFEVEVVADGREGLAYARYGNYDAIVLDLMLPHIDGISLLTQLRREDRNVHVLVLSARDQVSDRIRGLEAGADDYMVKPFEFDELVARLRALGRRRFAQKNPQQQVGPLVLDTARRSVSCASGPVDLSSREYTVFEYLVQRRGNVVTKGELLDRLYPHGDGGSDNTVEVFVHQLRKKIVSVASTDVVHTKRGHGYLVE
tara:strand:+ start:116001 stop:116666 length:666 start_codon:yes stop_codon:yes gene_type:complete